MERLIDRTEEGLICLNNNGNCGFIEQLIKAIGKLAAFEDFMEEQGFEDLEHLKLRLENLQHIAKYYVRWEKLKEWVGEFHRDVVAVYPKTLLTKIQKLELAD